MGDPHNPARIGELWNPQRWHVLSTEIDAVREFGALSGGWAWHYMSPPHQEEKHLHDHRDIDLHVFPERFAELVNALTDRGYNRQRTRFDNPSGEFIRFEKYVTDSCPKCYEQAMGVWSPTTLGRDEDGNPLPVEHGESWLECVECEYQPKEPGPVVKVIFDLFVHAVPTIEVNGYTVVEPNEMLTYYGIKHSSEQCVAVQAARRIQAKGGEIVNNPLLVGNWGL